MLRVYADRSELVHGDGEIEVFLEGPQTVATRQRYQTIRDALAAGFLERQIGLCRSGAADTADLTDAHRQWVDALVESVTANEGRALIVLTVLQLCVKVVAPEQNIRLHKGGRSRRDFSWQDGISMRSLDNTYITPVLREHDLLKVNADGGMMTRSLAENYPYSPVYKAHIRGARDAWLGLVDAVETDQARPLPLLHHLLSQLLNRAEAFRVLVKSSMVALDAFLARHETPAVVDLLMQHMDGSNHAARLLEIAMHSLMQVVIESETAAGLNLVPLSQMRSANKKYGNIADIEVRQDDVIVEAWDAKYGKVYLRDELEELADKLLMGYPVERAGFVTSAPPERLHELAARIAELEMMFSVDIQILTFAVWADMQLQQGNPGDWLRAYTESLAQLRRPIAPIDEPCYDWLVGLRDLLTEL